MMWLRIRLWLMGFRTQKHHSAKWDGTHATCSCGYSDVKDWDLSEHLKGLTP